MGHLTAIGRVLQQLPGQGSWPHIRRFAHIQAHWTELVGASVAVQTRPTAIYQQVLHVAVSSSVWAQALTFERITLLHKINQVLGKKKFPPIQDIRYSTARWMEVVAVAIAPSPRPQAAMEPTATAPEIVRRLAQGAGPKGRCPRCHGPCSSQEMSRWQMCRFCARDRWFVIQHPPRNDQLCP
jgi:predicted nucleic acid-binding Zn ribbon protein